MDKATIIVALITALAAILAPTINTIINNKHHKKEQKIQLTYIEKFKTYKDFYSAFGELQGETTIDTDRVFLSNAYKVLMICDSKSAELLKELLKIDIVSDNVRTKSVVNKFLDCANSLQADLEIYKNKAIKD